MQVDTRGGCCVRHGPSCVGSLLRLLRCSIGYGLAEQDSKISATDCCNDLSIAALIFLVMVERSTLDLVHTIWPVTVSVNSGN